jgi:hypothetical protein
MAQGKSTRKKEKKKERKKEANKEKRRTRDSENTLRMGTNMHTAKEK